MHGRRSATGRAASFAVLAIPMLGILADRAQSQAPAPQVSVGKRVCKPRIEWTGAGVSRADAQRKALDGWSAAAVATHGESFSKWAIAGIARVNCTLTPDGHRCRAAASPCRDLADGAGGQPKR
jgi:hypothetical protein